MFPVPPSNSKMLQKKRPQQSFSTPPPPPPLLKFRIRHTQYGQVQLLRHRQETEFGGPCVGVPGLMAHALDSGCSTLLNSQLLYFLKAGWIITDKTEGTSNRKKSAHAQLYRVFFSAHLFFNVQYFRHAEGIANTVGTCVAATQFKKIPHHVPSAPKLQGSPCPYYIPIPPSQR